MQLKQKKYGIIDMIILSFKTSPFHLIFFVAKSLLDSLLPMLSIFVTSNFINTAIAVYNKEVPLAKVYGSIALLVCIMIYTVLFGVVMNFQSTKRTIFYRRKLSPIMLEKIAKLEYRYIENQETADLINRVCPVFPDGVWDMFCAVINLASFGVFIISIMITLYVQVWWIALAMFLASIPILYFATKAGRESYGADIEMSKIDRRANYLSDALRNREAVEERSIFGYTENLNERYAERYEFARKFRMKIDRKNFIKQKTSSIVTSIYSIGAMLAF